MTQRKSDRARRVANLKTGSRPAPGGGYWEGGPNGPRHVGKKPGNPPYTPVFGGGHR